MDRNLKMRNLIILGLEDEENLISLEAKIINFIKEKIHDDININQIDYIKRIGASRMKTRLDQWWFLS